MHDIKLPSSINDSAKEPLAIVGLAANILQFVEFLRTLFSRARELNSIQSRIPVDFADLEAISRTTQALNSMIVSSAQDAGGSLSNKADRSPALHEIDSLTSDCNGISIQLVDTLTKLKRDHPVGQWRSLAQALRTIWSQPQIDGLRRRLESYRNTVQNALVVSLQSVPPHLVRVYSGPPSLYLFACEFWPLCVVC